VCSKQPREAELLDDDDQVADAGPAAGGLEIQQETGDETFDRDVDYLPIQDDDLYDEG